MPDCIIGRRERFPGIPEICGYLWGCGEVGAGLSRLAAGRLPLLRRTDFVLDKCNSRLPIEDYPGAIPFFSAATAPTLIPAASADARMV